jgi:hypothetical protein
MPKTLTAGPFWFIREGTKLIQCNKQEFDQAIIDGKSIWYRGYADKKSEKIANALEQSRMAFLSKPDLSPKFRAALTNPVNVVDVEIIDVCDSVFWEKESKLEKYR